MRFSNQSPLLLSVEDAGNIGAPAGGATPPAMERVVDDDISSILNDARTAPVGQVAQPDAGAQAAVATDVQPPATEQGQQAPPPVDQPPLPTQAAPPAQVDPLPAAPESILAPIFDLVTASPEEAASQAVDLMRNFYAADPLTYRLFANAVLQASPKSAAEFVLRANGIPQEKVGEFHAWLSRGGDHLPEPVEYPAFDATVMKLRASAEIDQDANNQWVRLLDGRELNLKNPDDADRYELAKLRYETETEKKQATRAETERQRQEEDTRKQNEAQQAEQAFFDRVNYFTEDRRGIIAPLLADTINNLAPADQLRGVMLQSLVTRLLEQSDPALLATFKQIDPQTAAALDSVSAIGNKLAPYLRDGAGFEKTPDGKWQLTGRAKALADQQAPYIRTVINGIKDKFNTDVLRTNRAELAATSTEPRIPENAKEVTSAAPQPPDFSNLTTLDEIIAAGRQYDRQSAGK